MLVNRNTVTLEGNGSDCVLYVCTCYFLNGLLHVLPVRTCIYVHTQIILYGYRSVAIKASAVNLE